MTKKTTPMNNRKPKQPNRTGQTSEGNIEKRKK